MNKAFDEILEMLNKRLGHYDSRHKILTDAGLFKDADKIADKMTEIDFAKQIVQEVAEEYNGGWIPVKTRPMTEEEKEYYSEYFVDGDIMIYECTLPDDGQEVLITSKFGSVEKTTFYTDCGNYFEDYEDYDEVIAWQPLPQPYKESE